MIKVLVRSKGANRPFLLYFIDPLTGKEVSRSAGTKVKREAERAAALWEKELADNPGRYGSTWEAFRDRFEDEHLAELSPKTRKGYITALNHFERLVKVNRVEDVTPSILSTYRASLRKEDRPQSSITNYLTHLRKALNWAEEIGWIRKAPKMGMPRAVKRKFMRGRPITEAEYRLIRKTCEKLYPNNASAWNRLLDLLWLSGLRLGEAIKCSWNRPPIQVQLDAEPHPQIAYFAEGQKSRQDSTVPLCPDFAAWLQATPPKQRKGLVAPVPLHSFDRISEFISALGESADIVVNDEGKFASAHDFRRAFGTRWAAKVRPLTLQRLMRHANIETTLKYYVGLSSADAGDELWSVPKAFPKLGIGHEKPA